MHGRTCDGNPGTYDGNLASAPLTNDLKDKVKESLETRSFTQLKDKLKDRAGGINKAMSGAKEALKSKLKDRSGDGLLSKAAAGFKEKVKYKLSGGGGGGLGSKMLGAAKAGGGLLRRLAGR
ncbi:hypothetical protein GIW81_13645 [Hyphomicrobium sp. xq]|uniref:Uncharacterized protein n=1 Tax=Hyphomicrobium album TaxID=2665159 RepID=A0A6I3KLY2_9HYPH|nr:hypothetical protein [Hyphomicrobium album]MTD95378.1 hypothetical protein [Hyphomicrobium album]